MNSVQNSVYQDAMEVRFAMAARHSRMVRVLRVAVPTAVVLALGAVVVVSVYNPFRMLLPKLPSLSTALPSRPGLRRHGA